MSAYPEALRAILAACSPLGSERVRLGDAAGRVAATNSVASEDLVPFARSAMDGFAVRAADLAAAPVDLPVRGRIYAESGLAVHAPQTVTVIATGAPIPRGADAVLPIEDVETRDGVVRVARPIPAGSHVFPPGEDARSGDVIVQRGTVLRPSTLGVLAAAGHAELEVYRKPRVAIVCTGDELVPIEATPAHGQIRNSNAATIASAAESLGGTVVSSLACDDDRIRLRESLAEALGAADLVITTGGASVGERDLVKPLLDELGVEFLFRSVALRPAKPSAFGIRPTNPSASVKSAEVGAATPAEKPSASTPTPTRVAVLPGNPSSAFAALQLLVRPALLALAGRRDPLPRLHPARLDGRVRAKPNSTYVAYARVRLIEGRLSAQPLPNQCSALTRSASEADGFIVVPPGIQTFTTGATVDVDVFDWTNVAATSDFAHAHAIFDSANAGATE